MLVETTDRHSSFRSKGPSFERLMSQAESLVNKMVVIFLVSPKATKKGGTQEKGQTHLVRTYELKPARQEAAFLTSDNNAQDLPRRRRTQSQSDVAMAGKR